MEAPTHHRHTATERPEAECEAEAEAAEAGSTSPNPPPAQASHPQQHASLAPTAAAGSHVTDAPPAFWSRHSRAVSYHSIHTVAPRPIVLEDHSADSHEQTQACWARSVSVDEYVVVSGPTGIGAYVIWHCTIETLKGGGLSLRKRYSEFDVLRANLMRAFPHAEAMIPQLPRKSVVSRFRPKFLEQRRAGLSHFLNCILLNPEFAASPILKDFIFY